MSSLPTSDDRLEVTHWSGYKSAYAPDTWLFILYSSNLGSPTVCPRSVVWVTQWVHLQWPHSKPWSHFWHQVSPASNLGLLGTNKAQMCALTATPKTLGHFPTQAENTRNPSDCHSITVIIWIHVNWHGWLRSNPYQINQWTNGDKLQVRKSLLIHLCVSRIDNSSTSLSIPEGPWNEAPKQCHIIEKKNCVSTCFQNVVQSRLYKQAIHDFLNRFPASCRLL